MSRTKPTPLKLVQAIKEAPTPTDRERQLKSHISKLESDLAKEKNRNTVIREAFREAAESLPELKPWPQRTEPRKREDPHVAMLDVSDVHVGEKVDPVLTGGIAEYSFDTFLRRGENLRRGLYRLVDMQRNVYPVDVLFVNFLGDMVTGEAIYPGQAYHIDRPLLRQVQAGADWFAELLRDFSRNFKRVEVRCIPGNHGRGYGRGWNHPLTNWDIGFYERLQLILKSHAESGRVNVQIEESSYMLYEIKDYSRHTHILFHGQQAKSWAGYPWYGVHRAGMGLQSMLGVPLDYIHLGHHHTPAKYEHNRVEFLANGAWTGGSDLSVNQMFRASRPVQNLFFCHKRRGIVSAFPIYLDDWAKIAPDGNGIYRPVDTKGEPRGR